MANLIQCWMVTLEAFIFQSKNWACFRAMTPDGFARRVSDGWILSNKLRFTLPCATSYHVIPVFRLTDARLRSFHFTLQSEMIRLESVSYDILPRWRTFSLHIWLLSPRIGGSAAFSLLRTYQARGIWIERLKTRPLWRGENINFFPLG